MHYQDTGDAKAVSLPRDLKSHTCTATSKINELFYCKYIKNDGKTGEKYNIGGENEWQNIKLLHKVIELTSAEVGKSAAEVEKTIVHVKDRPGHDARYAIDCTKIKNELGWERKMTFEQGLSMTVKWYLTHPDWVNHILSGEYKNWISRNYSDR